MYSVFYDFYFEMWTLHYQRYCNVSNQGSQCNHCISSHKFRLIAPNYKMNDGKSPPKCLSLGFEMYLLGDILTVILKIILNNSERRLFISVFI